MFGTIDFTWTPPSWLTDTGKRVERIVALSTDIIWDIDKAVTDIVVSDAASAVGVFTYNRNRIQRLVHIIGLETGKTVYAARRIGLAVACQVAYDAAVGTNTEMVRDRTIDLVQTLLDTYDERASWMTDYRADACKNGWLLVLDALTLTSTSRYWLAATPGGSEAPVRLSDAEKETVGKTISDALQNGDYDTVKGVFGEPHSDFLTGGRVQCQNRLPDAYYAAHPEEKEEDEVDGMEFVTRGYLKDGEAYVMPEHDMHDTDISDDDPMFMEPEPDDYGYVDENGKVAHTDGGGCDCLACQHIRAEREAHAERYLAVEKDAHPERFTSVELDEV